MGKTAAFRYCNMAGENLSPEEIGKEALVALDIALGIRGLCDLVLANRSGEIDYDDGALFQVIHAAMDKAIEVGNHLFYDSDFSQKGEE